jgi:hypothetical protein
MKPERLAELEDDYSGDEVDELIAYVRELEQERDAMLPCVAHMRHVDWQSAHEWEQTRKRLLEALDALNESEG